MSCVEKYEDDSMSHDEKNKWNLVDFGMKGILCLNDDTRLKEEDRETANADAKENFNVVIDH